MKYKPETIEENLVNINWVKSNINLVIGNYINRYNVINNIKCNIYYYNQALNLGFINYNWSYEIAMADLAYSIYGFTNDIYNKIAYALDFLTRIQCGSKNKSSIRNFDTDVVRLEQKGYISGFDKQILLSLRQDRNYGTHCGKLIFIDYVFQNYSLIYNLVCITEKILLNYSINEFEHNQYFNEQYVFIEDLKNTLNDFFISNNVA